MLASLRFLERSPAELLDRIHQAGWIALERALGARANRAFAIDAHEPVMPFGSLTHSDVTALREVDPKHVVEIIQRADRILGGHFNLLGYHDVPVGMPIDWQRDAISGRRGPSVHWSRVPFLDFEKMGDHKVTWELNRHQWMVTLGQASCLTAEPQYAEGAVTAILDWIRANPEGQGVNWASSLELALRTIAWIWTLHLLRDVARPTSAERSVIAGSLRAHGRHIERHLSTYFSPNTHLTGEALGLLYLGATLPSLPEAHRWSRKGFALLTREAGRQLRDDGTYFEQTMWYQGYTVDFLLHGLRLASQAGLEIPAAFRNRSEAAALALLNDLRPGGDVARIGDDDGGRLCGVDLADPADHRGTICLATLDLGWAKVPREGQPVPASVAWVAGLGAFTQLREYAVAPALPSRAFAEGGIYRLAGEGGSWMLVDAGPHGALTGAHAHADPTTFELALEDRIVVVDSGTGRYVGPEREELRAAFAHNVLLVEGRSCGATAGPFRWTATPATHVVQWHSDASFDFLEVEHDGYARGADQVRLRRRFVRLENIWVVIDQWSADSAVQVEARLHLASDLVATLTGPRSVQLNDASRHFTVTSDTDLSVLATKISPAYGRFEDTSVICLRPPERPTGYLLAVLGAANTPSYAVRADTADSSVAWDIRMGSVSGRLDLGPETGWQTPKTTLAETRVVWMPVHDGVLGDPVLLSSGRRRAATREPASARGQS